MKKEFCENVFFVLEVCVCETSSRASLFARDVCVVGTCVLYTYFYVTILLSLFARDVVCTDCVCCIISYFYGD